LYQTPEVVLAFAKDSRYTDFSIQAEIRAMAPKIRVAILDDHPSTVEGYVSRLSRSPGFEVIGTASFGEELEPLLARSPADVLLLDVGVQTGPENVNPYPILHAIPQLLQVHPDLRVLVISMYSERALIQAVMDAGANGYVFKDDRTANQELDSIVRAVACGGVYLSQRARQQILGHQPPAEGPLLTPRQLEALSLVAAYPDSTEAELARKLHVANSTFRNLLHNAYLRLNVSTRAAAVSKARHLRLITPPDPTWEAETAEDGDS
jgi:DNA-binding NarL/FixJ family response regulator